MIRIARATLLLFAAVSAAAQAKVYTFDYTVHADSDAAKPLVIFNTGRETYIELPADVEVTEVIVRKGKNEKPSAFRQKGRYIVVREPHDSIVVVTTKGEFTAEYVGKDKRKAEKMRLMQEGADGAGRQKALDIRPGEPVTADAGRPMSPAPAPNTERRFTGSFEVVEAGQNGPDEPKEPAAARAGAHKPETAPEAKQEKSAATLSIPSGAALSSVVSDFASSHGYAVTWQAKERYAMVSLRLEGEFEPLIDEVARAFGLTAYMVGKTLVFVDAAK